MSAASPRYRFIDADTHITEPADVWTSRVPAKWKELVPHVRFDDESQEEMWFVDGERLMPVGMTALAGFDGKFPAHPARYEDSHPGAYDATARLAYMDEIGCAAQVLYPNVGGFGSQLFLRLPNEELKLACVRAYNDFQIDWISPDPSRFAAVMAMPFWDVGACVKEIHRCADKGHKGILFTASPQDFGQPYLADKHWDPFWSAAQETGLPISFHIGSGDDISEMNPGRIEAMGMGGAYALSSCKLFLGLGMQLSDLLLSGVPARFPDLRFVSVESGIGWIPFVLEACDYSLEQADTSDRAPFDLKPSEYFERQVYSCYWFEKDAPRHFERVGVDRILFETDFPHPTCLYGNVEETIEAGLGNEPPAVREGILYGNAAKLYGLTPSVGEA
jgi:predicted TIM-barrel fold metal-dependent hydrolase